MRSLLDALQEGRLVELPESTKADALEFLAILIEAIPDIGAKTDLVKAVQDREAQFNTAIGKGVAVPHCRVSYDGELLCAVGWSPKGIDYGAPDGKLVHLVVMYYVPDRLRNMYLKEVSGLAKVLQQSASMDPLATLRDIQTVRDFLLDWVSQSADASGPDAKARMIKLDVRQAAIDQTQGLPLATLPGTAVPFTPFKLLLTKTECVVLSADKALAEALESFAGLREKIDARVDFTAAGYQVAVLSETGFSLERKLVEAVAVKREG